MQIDEAKLRQRFTYLWDRIGANGIRPLTSELFDQLWAAYHEPHRGYHNMQHIVDMLDLFDSERAHLSLGDDGANALELAIWFHDAVYYTQAVQPGVSNEELSAAWASRALRSSAAREYFDRVVPRLIMSTRIGHDAWGDALEDILHDLDYAILAAEMDRFHEYGDGIGSEWAHVPPHLFRLNRDAFLIDLLHSDRIYRTDHFHVLLEDRARENLSRVVIAESEEE